MRDRDNVLHRIEHWEDLLKMSDRLAELPTLVTAEHPLQMYPTVRTPRKALIASNAGRVYHLLAGRGG